MNAVVVVYDDLSDLLECIRWYHMVEEGFYPVILSRSETIGHDDVE